MSSAVFKMTFDTSACQAAIKKLGARATPAIVRSLNRAAVSTRTLMASAISKDMGLKVGDVREALRIDQATPSNHRAYVKAPLKRIPLIKFGARGPEPSMGRGRGVTAKTKAKRYPHAFIATVGKGRHRGVFERKTKKRLPIKELFGPSIGHVFEKHKAAGAARGLESLQKNLQSELKFALSKSA
jgi:hypothetical protein